MLAAVLIAAVWMLQAKGSVAEAPAECHDELCGVFVSSGCTYIKIAAMSVLPGASAAYVVDSMGAVQIALAD